MLQWTKGCSCSLQTPCGNYLKLLNLKNHNKQRVKSDTFLLWIYFSLLISHLSLLLKYWISYFKSNTIIFIHETNQNSTMIFEFRDSGRVLESGECYPLVQGVSMVQVVWFTLSGEKAFKCRINVNGYLVSMSSVGPVSRFSCYMTSRH